MWQRELRIPAPWTDSSILTLGTDDHDALVEFFNRRVAVAKTTISPSLRADQLYFCDLDRSTSIRLLAGTPEDPAAGELMESIICLAPLLMRRIVARARLFCPEHGACLPRKLRQASADKVRVISKVQLSCAQRAFGDLTAPRVQERIGRAYERFAAAQLRHLVDDVAVCEPDSAYYCMFAEFAMLACELGIDREMWEGLLPSLIRTQMLYAFVYGPMESAPESFTAFHRGYVGDRLVHERTLTLLRMQFANLHGRQLEHEASRHCAMLFRGEEIGDAGESSDSA